MSHYRAKYPDIEVVDEPLQGIVTFRLPGSKERLYMTEGLFQEWYVPVLTTTAEVEIAFE